jgi:hypothetical protein
MTGQSLEFLAERDSKIFAMRRTGMGTSEIARRFGLSTAAVNAAVRRQLEKLNREALLAYPEVLRLELERLDSLQQAIWPLTQHRKVKMDDGTEVQLEPDLRAVAEVRSIMAARSRLLGMEQANLSITLEQPEPVARAVLAGSERAAAEVERFDAESEAKAMLRVMVEAGVVSGDLVGELFGVRGELGSGEILDGEVVGDE